MISNVPLGQNTAYFRDSQKQWAQLKDWSCPHWFRWHGVPYWSCPHWVKWHGVSQLLSGQGKSGGEQRTCPMRMLFISKLYMCQCWKVLMFFESLVQLHLCIVAGRHWAQCPALCGVFCHQHVNQLNRCLVYQFLYLKMGFCDVSASRGCMRDWLCLLAFVKVSAS